MSAPDVDAIRVRGRGVNGAFPGCMRRPWQQGSRSPTMPTCGRSPTMLRRPPWAASIWAKQRVERRRRLARTGVDGPVEAVTRNGSARTRRRFALSLFKVGGRLQPGTV